MSNVRVVLCGMPTLLGAIVSQIATSRPRIQIIGQPREWKELVEIVGRKEVAVVVLGCKEDELMVLGNQLLREHPMLKILALTNDGREASHYELWPRRRPFVETSPESLLDAIEEVPDWSREA